MARLNNDFLMNLIQNTPEVKAGYMPKDLSGIMKMGSLYQPPTGPLYNVNMSEQYLNDDWSDNPRYNFQYEEDAINKMEDAYIDTGVEPDINDLKGAEFRLRDDLKPSMFENLRPAINTFKKEGINKNRLGYTFEDNLNTKIGLTSPINISDHYERLVGTKPTSPRNSEMIYTGEGDSPFMPVKGLPDDLMRDLNYEYPEQINRDAVNTVRHEIAHNVNRLPNYVDSTNFAENVNMNEVFGIPKALGSNPLGYGSNYDEDNMSAHAKEELFNRAKDSYYGRNDKYFPTNQPLRSDEYIKDGLQQYNQTNQPFHASNIYQGYIRPQVLQHFNQMKTDALNRQDNNAVTNNVTNTPGVGEGNGGGHVQTPGTYDTDISTGGSGDHRTMANGGRINFKNGGLASILYG